MAVCKGSGYIYIVQIPEYFGTDIYKVGRSCENYPTVKISRLNGYPKGTNLLFLTATVHGYEVELEKEILKRCSEKFRLVKGREWFDAPLSLLKNLINEVQKEIILQNCSLEKNVQNQDNSTLIDVYKHGLLYYCPKCSYITTYKGNFKRHIYTHESTNITEVERVKEIKRCDDTTIKHESERVAVCQKCYKNFKSMKGFANHICRLVPFNACSNCYKLFENRRQRRYHEVRCGLD